VRPHRAPRSRRTGRARRTQRSLRAELTGGAVASLSAELAARAVGLRRTVGRARALPCRAQLAERTVRRVRARNGAEGLVVERGLCGVLRLGRRIADKPDPGRHPVRGKIGDVAIERRVLDLRIEPREGAVHEH
jgi:hypothetical protein